MAAIFPKPAVSLWGPDTLLRRRVAEQLQSLGYRLADMPTRDGEAATILVVCPAASDREGVDAFRVILAHDTTPGRMACVFVLPGPTESLRRALDAVRGRHFCAILDASESIEMLQRQLGIAARWLETSQAGLVLPYCETGTTLSPA